MWFTNRIVAFWEIWPMKMAYFIVFAAILTTIVTGQMTPGKPILANFRKLVKYTIKVILKAWANIPGC